MLPGNLVIVTASLEGIAALLNGVCPQIRGHRFITSG